MEHQTPAASLFLGAVVALTAGLGAGATMRPHLTPHLTGPQILIGSSARRAPAQADDAVAFARYGVSTPQYVFGADAAEPARLAASADDVATYEPQDESAEPAPPESADGYAVEHASITAGAYASREDERAYGASNVQDHLSSDDEAAEQTYLPG